MLAPLIRLVDAAYRAGFPLMPDAAFDRLSRLTPNALPPITTALLSLDCHPDPEDWLARNPGPYAVQLKADGVSVNLVYEDGCFIHAHLRSGRDCTDAAIRAGAFLDLPGKPPGRVEIRCEAIGSLATNPPSHQATKPPSHQAAKPPTRNAVAAALRRKGPTDPTPLTLLAFDLVGIPGITTQIGALSWLKCCGFAVLDAIHATTPAEVLDTFDTFCACRNSLPFPCDGLVVKLDSIPLQHQLGNDSRCPRWAISLKP